MVQGGCGMTNGSEPAESVSAQLTGHIERRPASSSCADIASVRSPVRRGPVSEESANARGGDSLRPCPAIRLCSSAAQWNTAHLASILPSDIHTGEVTGSIPVSPTTALTCGFGQRLLRHRNHQAGSANGRTGTTAGTPPGRLIASASSPPQSNFSNSPGQLDTVTDTEPRATPLAGTSPRPAPTDQGFRRNERPQTSGTAAWHRARLAPNLHQGRTIRARARRTAAPR